MFSFFKKKKQEDGVKPEVTDIGPVAETDTESADENALIQGAESEAAVDATNDDSQVAVTAEEIPSPVAATTPAEAAKLNEAAEREQAVDMADGGLEPDLAAPAAKTSAPSLQANATEPELTPEETAANTEIITEGAEAEAAVDAAEGESALPEWALAADAKPKKEGYFARLKAKLVKTRNSLTGGVDGLFIKHSTIDDDLLEELEELLITADLGVETALDIVQAVAVKRDSDASQVKDTLKREILKRIMFEPKPQTAAKPEVIMVVGVNGVGKTTTIGKLASKWAGEGQQVMIGAGDTFRAAAVEQLEVWANRSGASIIKHKAQTDPAAVAYDAVEAGVSRGMDKVIIDTAGRLHTNSNLMEELKKIKRSIAKAMPEAPHEIWLVLDATTGQNALSQAKIFNEALELSGLILTKLDGTAKGGIVVAITNALNVQLKYIGIGEKVDDLQEFDPIQFVDALF